MLKKPFNFFSSSKANLEFCKNFYMKCKYFTTKQEDSNPQDEAKLNWNQTVRDAKNVVDYHKSLLNLYDRLSDYVKNVDDLSKLITSQESLLAKIAQIFHAKQDEDLTWMLIILLISKAASCTINREFSTIWLKQRVLAEMTELIHINYLAHNSIINPETNKKYTTLSSNTMNILIGDCLGGISFAEIGRLRNQEVTELIYAGMRDQYENEFIEPRDEQNYPLPTKPRFKIANVQQTAYCSVEPIRTKNALGHSESEWTLRQVLTGGSLIGKACLSCLKIAELHPHLQEQGYYSGKHMFLSWRAYKDKKIFKNPFQGPFSLITAPVFYHLEHDPNFYKEIEKGYKNVLNIDYKLIYENILNGPALEKTTRLQKFHSNCVLQHLNYFPESEAKSSIRNIMLAMDSL